MVNVGRYIFRKDSCTWYLIRFQCISMNCRWFARGVMGNCQLQHRNTSRSAMTSQCIILLWKDFIRSDLKRFFSACCKTPPPFRLKIQCVLSQAMLCCKMLMLQNICRTTSGILLTLHLPLSCFIIPSNLAWLKLYWLSWATSAPRHRLFIEQLIGTSAPLGDQFPKPLIYWRLSWWPGYDNPQDLVYSDFPGFQYKTKGNVNNYILTNLGMILPLPKLSWQISNNLPAFEVRSMVAFRWSNWILASSASTWNAMDNTSAMEGWVANSGSERRCEKYYSKNAEWLHFFIHRNRSSPDTIDT